MSAKKRINWKMVLSNVAEAREELERLEGMIKGKGPLPRSEPVLEVSLSHAYFHLNWAWGSRTWPMSKHRTFTNAEWHRAGRFPRDIWLASDHTPGESSRRRGSTRS